MSTKTYHKKKKQFNDATDKAVLRIFLSHKLGKSKEKAQKVATALSILANDRMTICYSANFDRGDQWENKIREGLDSSDWFILLYDGPDVNHDWCLWEAGYFRANMKSNPDKRLICLHDPRHNIPGPLRGFTPVPARQDEVYDLFRQIYLDEPWKIRPELFAQEGQDEIREKVRRIIKELTHEQEIEAQFPLSPSITFHVKRQDANELEKGIIPNNTIVSGDGAWEVVFGKLNATVAWSWKQLQEGLVDWEPWAHQLAGMMDDAYKFQIVSQPSMKFRIKLKDESEAIYRVILRRLERTSEELSFTFAVAKIITSYRPQNHINETRIFHLYNMAWFFRRHFLEKHLEALKELNVLTNPSKTKIEEEIRSIIDDKKALLAEAQTRGIEDPARIIQAFDEPLKREVSIALQETWPLLDAALTTATGRQPHNLGAIINAIDSMKDINSYFLRVCLESLRNLSK